MKVNGTGDARVEAMAIGDKFRAQIVDSTTESFVFEIVGSSDTVDRFIEEIMPRGLVEVSRTGIVAIARGAEEM